MNTISISIASGWPISPVNGSKIWAIARPIWRSAMRPQNFTAAKTSTAMTPIDSPYIASLLNSSIACNMRLFPTSFRSAENGAVHEKKTAIRTTAATLMRTGMLFQPKTGSTRKNAEILVRTIAKVNSFPIITSIRQCPMF